MIGVINYEINNLKSITNFLQEQNLDFLVVDNPKMLNNCDRLVLPGVGSFGRGMQSLDRQGLSSEIVAFANSGKPVLGICLGMQLLFETSEEFGQSSGLGLIKGRVVSIATPGFPKVHMGWNNISTTKKSKLIKTENLLLDVYFAHSFHCNPTDRSDISAISEFGIDITAAVEKDNIFGVQFHPEKSQVFGKKILLEFADLA
jgi:glutamine amidotransferase